MRIVRRLRIEFSNEFVDRPFVLVFLLKLPIKERAYWEVSQDRVEQTFDLVGIPYKLSLDGREVNITVDLAYDVAYSDRNVFHDFRFSEFGGWVSFLISHFPRLRHSEDFWRQTPYWFRS